MCTKKKKKEKKKGNRILVARPHLEVDDFLAVVGTVAGGAVDQVVALGLLVRRVEGVERLCKC